MEARFVFCCLQHLEPSLATMSKILFHATVSKILFHATVSKILFHGSALPVIHAEHATATTSATAGCAATKLPSLGTFMAFLCPC